MLDELEELLKPIRDDAPAGVDIEYDADFADMDKAAVGTPEQEFGSTKIEGEPADWTKVRKLAVGLLRRSKDIRVGAYFAEAELHCRGLVGFRDALTILAHIVTEHWESHYPLLDPDDDNDPTIRLNALARLTSAGGLIRQLRQTPIVRSHSSGVLSWNDCAIARGEIPAPEGMENPPNQTRVDAVVKSCKPDELKEWAASVTESLALLSKIDEGFSVQVGSINSPEFDPLKKELESIAKFHRTWLKQFESDQPAETEPIAGEANEKSIPAARPVAAALVVKFGSGTPANRTEALDALEKVASWFESNEPSSPVPMLLKRARRLASMSFMEILKDISPDGVNQAVVVGGAAAESPE
jgi:type VI secretion system protein ImpA